MRDFFIFIGKVFAILIAPIRVKFLSIINYIRTGFKTFGIKKLGYRSVLWEGVDIVGQQYMTIGDNVDVGRGSTLSAKKKLSNDPELIIKNGVSIGSYAHITACNRIVIGDGVLIGKGVTISDNNHGTFDRQSLGIPPILRQVYSKGEVIIGQRVWIGDKATILSAVVGDGTIIGANTVVTHDVPPNSIVVGNPGRIIKTI